MTAIPTTLDEVLEISNARNSYQTQLNLARLKFVNACRIGHNGIQYDITPDKIGYLTHLNSIGESRSVLLDDAGFPFLVDDIEEFLDIVSDQYHSSLNKYFDEVTRLRASRIPANIMNVE